MKQSLDQNFPKSDLGEAEFKNFCGALRNRYRIDSPTMEIFREPRFRDAYRLAAAETINHTVSNAISYLTDKRYGMAVIDIPEIEGFTGAHSQFVSFACAAGIFSSLATVRLVPPNNVPFGLHLARKTKRENEDGSKPIQYTSDAEFGFHTDGITASGSLYIPNVIGVYNLFLAYNRPGHFHWLPYSIWPDFSKYAEIADLRKPVEIEILPAAYLGKSGKEIVGGSKFAYVPVVKISADSKRPIFFLNGNLLQRDAHSKSVGEWLTEMRLSINDSPGRLSIPQKERRLVIINNSYGFHARDMLTEPNSGLDISRVFARFIGADGEIFGHLSKWESSQIEEQ